MAGLKTFDEAKVFDAIVDEERKKHDDKFFWDLAYKSALARSKQLPKGEQTQIFIEGFVHGILFTLAVDGLEDLYGELKQRATRVSASVGRDKDDKSGDSVPK